MTVFGAKKTESTFKPSMAANAARGFVWSLWLLLLAADLWALATTSRNVPIGEDWFVVPSFTGKEPEFVSWLWAQNNEHRVPLPKLIMVGILKITGGDFRSVQLLNILLIAAVAAGCMRKAASLRGNLYSFSDAVFPLVSLHFGHSENMLWAWQITFVSSFVLISVILLQMVSNDGLRRPRSALIAGSALVLLPLTGATGLLFVPLLGAWFVVSGIIELTGGDGERRAPVMLISAAALTLFVSVVYFIGYESPAVAHARLPFGLALWSAALATSFGFGPSARVLDLIAAPLTILLMLGTGVILIRQFTAARSVDRRQTAGLAVFFAASAGYLLALGYTRGGAAIFEFHQWPLRYSLMAAPMIYCCQYIWNLHGGRAAQAGMAALTFAVLVLAPFNVAHGRIWSTWFRQGADRMMADIQKGVTASELAAAHRGFIPEWLDREKSVEYLQMLHDAGVHPYDRLRPEIPTSVHSMNTMTLEPSDGLQVTEFTYYAPGVTEAVLVWGVDGWQKLPEESRPADTSIDNSVMRTVLARSGNEFHAQLRLPRGSLFDFGISINKCADKPISPAVWDDLHGAVIPNGGAINVRSLLRCDDIGGVVFTSAAAPVTKSFRYVNREAGEVWIVWGVNGWHAVEGKYRNTGTVASSQGMRELMKRGDNGFKADVTAPEGSTINFGFLVTRRGCCQGLSRYIWDSPQNATANSAEPVVVRSRTPIQDEAATLFLTWREIAIALAALVATTTFLTLTSARSSANRRAT